MFVTFGFSHVFTYLPTNRVLRVTNVVDLFEELMHLFVLCFVIRSLFRNNN